MNRLLEHRASGILLHITSLPGAFGIGDFGPSAREFVDFLADAGQSWWQTLPISALGADHSPYSATSVFAIEPLLISLEDLVDDGLLNRRDLPSAAPDADRIDFSRVERLKQPLLERAFRAAGRAPDDFRRRHAWWLEDYARFSAARALHGGPWTRWAAPLRDRTGLSGLPDESIRFAVFLQWVAERQWLRLREYARRAGVRFIGDIPCFAAHDSADVWSHPEYFTVNADGSLRAVAGVPPDYFSRTGQLWGYPLYRWNVLRRHGYDWWIDRFRLNFERFDVIRLDHFIGFHRAWEVPAGAATAERGRWVAGPGAHFFDTVRRRLGRLDFIAEDLGTVTDEVRALRDRFGLPGMRVLQFAFGNDPEARTYRPHNYHAESVVYTGTHDNDTIVGWFNDTGSAASTRRPDEIRRERAFVLQYLGTDGRDIHWDLIRLASLSVSTVSLFPIQDVLGLGSEARMNLPGTGEGNWTWKLTRRALTPRVASRLRDLSEIYERTHERTPHETTRPHPHRRRHSGR